MTSSGLSSLLAASTKPMYFPGRNQLGPVLESIRQDLMREAVLSEQFGINDLLDPDCVPLKYKCIKSGIIPQQWKYAIIAPIFLKGDRSLAKNYRSVSLTSVICKVLEKIIVIQISEHLKAKSLTCPA